MCRADAAMPLTSPIDRARQERGRPGYPRKSASFAVSSIRMLGILTESNDTLEVCGIDPGLVCGWILDVTGSGNAARLVEWLLARPLKVVLIFAVAWVVNRIARRAIGIAIHRLMTRMEVEPEFDEEDLADRALRQLNLLTERSERSRQRAETLGVVFRSLTTAAIYTIAILMALGEFNVNLGPLIAGAGIVGVALGFGAQTVVRDFLSGIFMLIEDQYGVGDVIDVGDAVGSVEAVSLRTTRIRDVDGTVWFVPNGEIKRVGNKSQEWARAVLDVQVAYDTDLPRAARVIYEAAKAVYDEALEGATILEEPEIWGVQDFGADSVAIRLAVKTEPGEQFAVAREIRGRLKAAFDDAGIVIPFPQRTVWIHRGDKETVASGPLPAHRRPEKLGER